MGDADHDALRIRFESSRVDPLSGRFVVDRPVAPGGPYVFPTSASAQRSPLARRLFTLPGVDSVLIHGWLIQVTLTQGDWSQLAKSVGAEIRSQLQSNEPPVDFSEPQAPIDPALDSRIGEQVENVLAREINPSVASHGGRIDLVKVEGRVVYLRMTGGCQGCGSAAVTLRQGVESSLRRHVPHIARIQDITDHDAGEHPYFAAEPGQSPWAAPLAKH